MKRILNSFCRICWKSFLWSKNLVTITSSDKKFYCQIFSTHSQIIEKDDKRSKNFNLPNGWRSKHKNQILKIKRFAVFKNHKNFPAFPLVEYKSSLQFQWLILSIADTAHTKSGWILTGVITARNFIVIKS